MKPDWRVEAHKRFVQVGKSHKIEPAKKCTVCVITAEVVKKVLGFFTYRN